MPLEAGNLVLPLIGLVQKLFELLPHRHEVLERRTAFLPDATESLFQALRVHEFHVPPLVVQDALELLVNIVGTAGRSLLCGLIAGWALFGRLLFIRGLLLFVQGVRLACTEFLGPRRRLPCGLVSSLRPLRGLPGQALRLGSFLCCLFRRRLGFRRRLDVCSSRLRLFHGSCCQGGSFSCFLRLGSSLLGRLLSEFELLGANFGRLPAQELLGLGRALSLLNGLLCVHLRALGPQELRGSSFSRRSRRRCRVSRRLHALGRFLGGSGGLGVLLGGLLRAGHQVQVARGRLLQLFGTSVAVQLAKKLIKLRDPGLQKRQLVGRCREPLLDLFRIVAVARDVFEPLQQAGVVRWGRVQFHVVHGSRLGVDPPTQGPLQGQALIREG